MREKLSRDGSYIIIGFYTRHRFEHSKSTRFQKNSILIKKLQIPLYYLSWAVYNVFFHPLRKYPGPWYASCSHLWWAYHGWIGDLVMATTKLHERYGEVVRISPDGLSYINSQAVSFI